MYLRSINIQDLGSIKLSLELSLSSQSSACTSCCIFLARLRVIGPVGVGVEVGNVVDDVGKVVGVVDDAGVCISRREQAAGIQTAGSRGSVQPQLDGWVHSTVMGVMVLTRRRWRGAAAEWMQSRAEVAEPGRRRRLEQLRLLDGAVRGFAGRRQGPRTGAPSDGLAFRTARRYGAPAARVASGSSTGGLRCSSPTASPSPSPYPPLLFSCGGQGKTSPMVAAE
jgi:hypothetical protein